MTDTAARLAYMANQIARNFAVAGVDKAATATADHIAAYWDPRMRARIFAMAEAADPALDDIALSAVRLLIKQGPPPPQTPATAFATADQVGGSDAG